MRFVQYIRNLRDLLKEGSCRKFVIGNSGADYDSVVGSILFAYYLTIAENMLCLPLVDCPEEDISLRFEQVKIFKELGLNQSQLLYSNMIMNLYSSGYYFALNDHNWRQQIPAEFLLQIIDHHAYEPQSIKCNHIIHHCGSALTLIYYLYYPELLHKFKGHELQEKFQKYQAQTMYERVQAEDQNIIDELIYYGVMIDSYGLNPKHNQVWNEFDKHAIETISTRIKPKFSFQELGQAKYNLELNLQLSFAQQQKKDYKYLKYQTFCAHYSVILMDINVFVKVYWGQLITSLPADEMQENEAHIFMFTFPTKPQDISTGNFKRFILYNAKETKILNKMEGILATKGFTKMDDVNGWRKWQDPTGKVSRKILDHHIRSTDSIGEKQIL